MFDFSTVSIVLYSISGLLFIVFFIMFFMTDVWSSIKFIKQKGKSNDDSRIITSNITDEKNNNSVILKNHIYHNSSKYNEIEYAQQTVDVDTLTQKNTNAIMFATQDWELPEGVSFILTKNIIVCHSDKEYIQREC